MKINLSGTFKLVILLICITCVNSYAQYKWTKKADFAAGIRNGAYAFSIGNKGYVGGGATTNGTVISYPNDFWEYDAATDVWTQKATFSANVRSVATAFALNNKGYVCMGYNGSTTYLNDLWQYDPVANTWIQKASFPGAARYTCASFIIGNYAYVGMGKSGGYYADFYKYDVVNNSWTAIANIPGPLRQSAAGFAIGNYGYVACGATDINNYNDLWQYNPSNNTWIQKTPYPGSGRNNLASFVYNGLAYIGTGGKANTPAPNTFADFYSYDATTDTWTFFCNFPGANRYAMVSIPIGSKFYIGLGSAGVYPVLDYKNDWWELAFSTPVIDNEDITIYPNPAYDFLTFNNSYKGGDYSAKVFDDKGAMVADFKLQNNLKTAVKVSAWADGIYLYSIISNDKIIKSSRVVVSH